MDFDEIKLPNIPEYCPQCNRKTIGAIPFCRCNFDLRYGNPRRKKTGICIYCPDKGVIPLSEEHIFGKWLTRRFPKSPTIKTFHSLRRPEGLVFWKKSILHERTYDRRGHQYYWTVWNVCQECNTGWMSGVHKEAQKIVVRFAGGEWPDLTHKEQLILSRWVTMVAINLECVSRQFLTSQFQRDSLKKETMPAGWRVAVCRMKGDRHAGFNFLRKKNCPIRVGEEFLTIQSSFFCVEGVTFHALSSYGDRVLSLGLLEDLNPPVFSERKIWPKLESRRIGRRVYYTADDLRRLQDIFAQI